MTIKPDHAAAIRSRFAYRLSGPSRDEIDKAELFGEGWQLLLTHDEYDDIRSVVREAQAIALRFPPLRSTPRELAAQMNAKPEPKPYDGSKRWAQLHRRGLAFAGDVVREAMYLGGMIATLPCGDCRNDAAKYVDGHPPDLSSAGAYFVWGVAFHNHVNAKLGKPAMTIEQARERWASPT